MTCRNLLGIPYRRSTGTCVECTPLIVRRELGIPLHLADGLHRERARGRCKGCRGTGVSYGPGRNIEGFFRSPECEIRFRIVGSGLLQIPAQPSSSRRRPPGFTYRSPIREWCLPARLPFPVLA